MSAREIIGNEITVGFDVDIPTSEIVSNILAALKDAGYAVVRREPSKKMVKAGCASAWDATEAMGDDVITFTGVWSAMLAAAEEQE